MSYFAEELKKLGKIYLSDQLSYYEKLKAKSDDEKMFNYTCKGLRTIAPFGLENALNTEDLSFLTDIPAEKRQALETLVGDLFASRTRED